MSTLDEIKILVKAEVTSAITSLDKLEKQTDQNKTKASKMMETFGKMRDVMQGPVAAFNMVAGAVKAVAGEVDKYIMIAAETEKVQAILNSTLEATGATAWTSAAKLNDYASAMADVTLYDDDAITGMQGILLGFRNITGVNFDKASTEILNMAQVMGMDLTSAAQAVGKALDNPIAGLDSLSKQGFKFSAAEKEVIKNLVETNHLADAQDIILKELSNTYGGAAKAAADTATGSYLNMKKALGEVNEAIGIALANSGAWSSLGKFFNGIADGIGNINKAKSIKEKVKELQDLMGTRGFQAKGALSQAEAISEIGLNAKDAAAGIEMLSGMIAENEKQQKEWYNVINPLSGLNRELDKENKSLKTQKENLEALLSTLASVGDVKAKNALIQKNANDAEAKASESDAKRNAENIQKAMYWLEDNTRQNEESMAKAAEDKAKRVEEALADEEAARQKSIYWLDEMAEKNGEILDQEARDAEERKAIADSVAEANKRAAKESAEAWDATRQSMIDMASNVASEYMKYEKNKSDILIAGMEKNRDAMKKNGKDTTAIEREINREKNRIAKQQFEAEKLNKLASIAMSTAQAAAQTLVYDPTGTLALLVSGLGVAQGALVAGQSYVPMAEGGSGRVTKPTLFLAGEAGPESFAFGGANDKALGGTTVNNFTFNGSPWAINEAEAMVVGAMAKANRGY